MGFEVSDQLRELDFRLGAAWLLRDDCIIGCLQFLSGHQTGTEVGASESVLMALN